MKNIIVIASDDEPMPFKDEFEAGMKGEALSFETEDGNEFDEQYLEADTRAAYAGYLLGRRHGEEQKQ